MKNPGFDAHEALKEVVLDKTLLKDIKRLTKFCHTGMLEVCVCHSLVTKYCPKWQHFGYKDMMARIQLAALGHNPQHWLRISNNK